MSKAERLERLLDLKVQEATYGLSREEVMELRRLSEEFPDWDGDESFALSVASVQLIGIDEEPMPNRLMRSIEEEYSRLYASEPTSSDRRLPNQVENKIGNIFDTKWLGWVLAGAFGATLLVSSFSNQQGPIQIETIATAPSAQEELDQLVKSAGDVVRNKWESQSEDFQFEGEVVWSEGKQKGFMRFKGLPRNDKTKETYQLWIFDENQKPENPVDGGVFDSGSDGEVIVPIQAKLEVKNASMFAVTVEKPGGVVVSDRKRLIGIAKVANKA
jgi:hypothetical protein